MDFNKIVDLLFHLDVDKLNAFLNQYSVWAYVFIFIVIFIETGLVVTPFLPGDSLLFAAGAAVAVRPADIPFVLVMLYIAAVLGDTVNYHIGHFLREKIKRREKIRFVKMEYIERAQSFLEKHGGKTITIARFIPIIRTFAPFVAGAGKMTYSRFLSFNVIGGLAWVTLFFGMGFFVGNISYVQSHFSLILAAIVLISVSPAVVVFIRNKMKKKEPNANQIAE